MHEYSAQLAVRYGRMRVCGPDRQIDCVPGRMRRVSAKPFRMRPSSHTLRRRWRTRPLRGMPFATKARSQISARAVLVVQVLYERERHLRSFPQVPFFCVFTTPIQMPKRGLEPPLPNGNQLLKLARLPVPPLRPDCSSYVRSGGSVKARAQPKGRLGPLPLGFGGGGRLGMGGWLLFICGAAPWVTVHDQLFAPVLATPLRVLPLLMLPL